jgi:xylan 1,4-beta-xylosidase
MKREGAGVMPHDRPSQDAKTHAVTLEVSAEHQLGPWQPNWNWFGYDEPNYSYAPNGQLLLRKLATLGTVPVYVRVHNLLTSGDGTAALKWGSTGAYAEDASGSPVYDWTITDRIFDAFVGSGVTPFVQVGFMPEALSTNPQPYQHDFPKGSITTGWAYPPRDLGRWGALVSAWAAHLRDRYGEGAVRGWVWEVWNEPDGLYWRGTADEFCALYDTTVAALSAVLPGLRVGGPHTCSPDNPRAAAFLRHFLHHCTRGRNHVTGATGSQLDFLAFHAKGKPELVDGRVRMGLAKQLRDIECGLAIIDEFPELRGRPVILGESDPEGCAACSAAMHPENAYRDGPIYGAYVAEALARTMELAARAGRPIEGSVTWAFEFEDQPPFIGLRELATNGIDKAVLNAFRLMGMLRGQRVDSRSDAVRPLGQILAEGVRDRPDIDLLATRDGNEVSILVWHYHDDEATTDTAPMPVALRVNDLPRHLHVTHRRVDAAHGNAHAVWQQMGSPRSFSPEQRNLLEQASVPGVVASGPAETEGGVLQLSFALPRHAVSLLQITW